MLLVVTALMRTVLVATDVSIVSVGNVTVGIGGTPALALCVKHAEAVRARLRRANVIFFMVVKWLRIAAGVLRNVFGVK